MSTQVQVAASLNSQASPAGIMEAPMVEIEHVSLWYGEKLALKDISMSIPKHRVTAYIGPSGCGKTTLLRCLNRMNDLVDGVRMAGNIRIGGTDIHDPTLDVTELRKRVGMVFQKSNPFPKSIFENVASTARGSSEPAAGATSRRSWNGACAAPRCGTRSAIASARVPWGSRAASSSGCASPAPSRPIRRCC